ncbi:MAG: hypothetical protein GF383_01295 [Candidatus Lokiarchaeota archaeon]|nr:hypothetical protein [Candidatus Lokiarchaeota archaeon]
MSDEIRNRKTRKQNLKFLINAEDIRVLAHKDNKRKDGEDLGVQINNKSMKYKEFVVNDYISLKLEGSNTNVYVKGEKFTQCMRLLITIPYEKISLYNHIESIDEAIEVHNKSLFQNRVVTGPEARPFRGIRHKISPLEEFQGHCSNIQAWAENDYNTCILHSNIAFPLLKRLTEVGDPKAKRIFKEEIARRFAKGNLNVRKFLKARGYMNFLSKEEMVTLFCTTIQEILSERDIDNIEGNNSQGSKALLSIISIYDQISEIFGNKKAIGFLESCTKNINDLIYSEIKEKKKTTPNRNQIKERILKKKRFIFQISRLRKNLRFNSVLGNFLQNLEIFAKLIDPEIIKDTLGSFKTLNKLSL